LEGLRDLGYEEGKTVTFEWRWWNDQVERLPELAAELVSLDVQAIVTAGTPAAKALKNATRSIPIIMAVIGDPVAAGLSIVLRTRAEMLRGLAFSHLTLVESGWSC